MAFSIEDIIRYFSQAADGQRMTNEPVPSGQGILNQPTVAAPASAPTQRPAQRPAQRPQQFTPVAALNPTDQRLAGGTQASPMEAATAVPVEQNPTDQRLVNNTQFTPMAAAMEQNPTDQRLANNTQGSPMAPEAGPGILSQAGGYLNKAFGLDQPDLISRIGYGLGVAGSQDPFKALMMLKEQQANEAKNKAEMDQKNKPKFTPLAGGALVMAEIPGMAPQIIPAAQVQDWLLKVEGVKADNAQIRQVNALRESDRLKALELDRKNVTEAAGGVATKPEFNQEVRNNLDRVDALIAAVPKADTLPGGYNNPMIANAIDQTFGRLAGTPDYETRRNVDTVFKEVTLSFVKKLGSNPSEGDRLFAERMQAAQDDPTSRKLALLQQYRDMTETAENNRVANATKRDAMNPAARPQGATAAPAAPAAAPMAVPGLSPKASKYFN